MATDLGAGCEGDLPHGVQVTSTVADDGTGVTEPVAVNVIVMLATVVFHVMITLSLLLAARLRSLDGLADPILLISDIDHDIGLPPMFMTVIVVVAGEGALQVPRATLGGETLSDAGVAVGLGVTVGTGVAVLVGDGVAPGGVVGLGVGVGPGPLNVGVAPGVVVEVAPAAVSLGCA